MTLPASINSGKSFVLSWKHKNGIGNYGYSISCSCATGLSLYAPTPSGNSQKVPCDTVFNFTNATETIQLTPTLKSNTQVQTTVTVSATKLSDGSLGAKGTANTVVLPATSAVTKTTTSPNTTYVAANKTAALYGLPNLSAYINNATPSSSGRFMVEFTIANTGTNVAQSGWMFDAMLPLEPTYMYRSSSQQALYPGDKIVYTLGFNIPTPAYISPYAPYMPQNNCGYAQSYTYNGVYNIPNDPLYNCSNSYADNYSYAHTPNYYGNRAQGPRAFIINVDPQNFFRETNEADNTAGIPIN